MQLPQLQKLPPVPLICVHTDQKGLGANKTRDTYLPTAACRRVAKEEHSEGKKESGMLRKSRDKSTAHCNTETFLLRGI